jgi:hypothetical protein
MLTVETVVRGCASCRDLGDRDTHIRQMLCNEDDVSVGIGSGHPFTGPPGSPR